MEHITVKNMANGYVKLTPEEGYTLYNKSTKQTYSEAVVKESEAARFVAKRIEV